MADFAAKVIKPVRGKQWKGFHGGRRGLGTKLQSLTGSSTAARDVRGHATTRVTETHYEHMLPEDALSGMKLLEAEVKTKS